MNVPILSRTSFTCLTSLKSASTSLTSNNIRLSVRNSNNELCLNKKTFCLNWWCNLFAWIFIFLCSKTLSPSNMPIAHVHDFNKIDWSEDFGLHWKIHFQNKGKYVTTANILWSLRFWYRQCFWMHHSKSSKRVKCKIQKKIYVNCVYALKQRSMTRK